MLNKLMIKLENNLIFSEGYFEDCDFDELLDLRDDDEFDSEWIRVYDILNQIEVKQDEKMAIDAIRELLFLRIYNFSKSSDIASCVSDDFEIICKAYISRYNDNWLNSLIISYANGKFPCGKLSMVNLNIEECMRVLLS